MKALRFATVLIIAVYYSGFAQETTEKLPYNVDLSIISMENQGSSYITFPTDIGNMEPLIFEANLIPNFMLRKNKNSRLMGVLTPQIILRMYNEYSYPVRTPSYMPQLTALYLIGNKKKSNLLTLFGRLAHHSNGQQDDLILDSGQINRLSGDFATNYVEGGGIITNFNHKTRAVRFFKTSFEYHPENSVHRQLKGEFSRFRWHFEFSAFKLPKIKTSGKTKPDISLNLKTTWQFGDIPSLDFFSYERLQAGLTLSYYPDFLDEMGFFIQFYTGRDYYNLYFDKYRSMIRFGLMTDKLRF